MTHSTIASAHVPHFCSYHILASSVISNSTDTKRKTEKKKKTKQNTETESICYKDVTNVTVTLEQSRVKKTEQNHNFQCQKFKNLLLLFLAHK